MRACRCDDNEDGVAIQGLVVAVVVDVEVMGEAVNKLESIHDVDRGDETEFGG